MRAVLVDEPGGPEKLYIGEAESPEPGPDELLVRVHATALNRADLMQREGRYPPPPGASPILGLEMAGIVEAMGEGCASWALGDRVCGLLPGGGYAEYAVIHKDLAIRIPSNLSYEEGAAFPEVFLTAYQALHWYGGLSAGQNVLIHAGASGVGTAAVQLVRSAGASALVTASSAKLQACLHLGAEVAIDYASEDFPQRVQEATAGKGADIIIDFIGGPYLKKNIECLAVDGRVVILATMGGSTVDAFDLRSLFRKRGSVATTTLRNRSLEYKIRLTRDVSGDVVPLLRSGTVRPVIDSIYDWKDVADAHRYMGENRNVGKIVLRVT